MHKTMTKLKNALGYVKFANDELGDAIIEVIDQLGIDLATADYEEGTEVELAITELEDVLNGIDSADEDVSEVISKAKQGELEEGEEEDDATDKVE